MVDMLFSALCRRPILDLALGGEALEVAFVAETWLGDGWLVAVLSLVCPRRKEARDQV